MVLVSGQEESKRHTATAGTVQSQANGSCAHGLSSKSGKKSRNALSFTARFLLLNTRNLAALPREQKEGGGFLISNTSPSFSDLQRPLSNLIHAKFGMTHVMALRGVFCREEQVFLTTGAQQGMSLLARLLLDFQGTVLVEETIYSGVLQAVESLQPKLLTVPTDPKTGMDVDAVTSLLEGQSRPSFIYAISDGHNPLGVSLSLEKRRRLVDLANHYHVPILEDDAYGLLYYDDGFLPPMRALDEELVFYLGSFSKILAPALRVGWIIIPETLTPALSALKEGSDINTATFSQRSIAAYLDTGQLPDHLIKLRHEYRTRRDTMLRALQIHFPPGALWYKPRNGMFIWVEIPGEVDMGEVLRVAVEKEQVAFVPGHAFRVGGSRHAAHCMRLNFSNCSAERIEYGIAQLARIIGSLSFPS